MNREAFELLASIEAEARPFFLFVNYMDAHWPYLPPPPFDERYPGAGQRFDSARYWELENDVIGLVRSSTPEERRQLNSQYDCALAYLDEHVGRLIDRLREMRRYDDALVIVVSDHGEAFGERNLVGHGVSVYQDQLRAALMVKYPKGSAGKVIAEPVSVVDVLPTILDVASLSAPSGLPGRSLRRLEPGTARPIVGESFSSMRLSQIHQRFDRTQRALIRGRWKLIAGSNGQRELYDLVRDPREQTDLSEAAPQRVGEMESALENWLGSVSRPPGAFPSRTPRRCNACAISDTSNRHGELVVRRARRGPRRSTARCLRSFRAARGADPRLWISSADRPSLRAPIASVRPFAGATDSRPCPSRFWGELRGTERHRGSCRPGGAGRSTP